MKSILLCVGLAVSAVSGQTLGSVIAAGSPCVTSVAQGLTNQIANEMTLMGITFARISTVPRVTCNNGCSGLLQKKALDSLASITAAYESITLTSAWRSAAQQYLLYQWKARGQCGQTNPVATPGTSNHEGGIAIDTPYPDFWAAKLQAHGWIYPMPVADPVHFEFGTGARSFAQSNLKAFQRLYNKHTAGANIAEDGVYGPATAAALNAAPVNGWTTVLTAEDTALLEAASLANEAPENVFEYFGEEAGFLE